MTRIIICFLAIASLTLPIDLKIALASDNKHSIDWTDEDRRRAKLFLSNKSSYRTKNLDFSNLDTYKHVVRQWELAGFSKERYPGLHLSLKEAREKHLKGQFDKIPATATVTEEKILVPTGIITGMVDGSYDPSNSPIAYTATGESSVYQPEDQNTTISYVSLCFYDKSQNPVGTCDIKSNLKGTLYEELINSVSSPDTEVTASLLASYATMTASDFPETEPFAETTTYVSQHAQINFNEYESAETISVTEPLIVSGNSENTNTMVCVSRAALGNGGFDSLKCDYGSDANDDVIINIIGAIQYDPSQPPTTYTNSQGAVVPVGSADIYVANENGGGCDASSPDSGTKFFDNAIACPADDKFTGVCYDSVNLILKWNFQDVDFGKAQDRQCGDAGDLLKFRLNVNVTDSQSGDEINSSIFSVAGVLVPQPTGIGGGKIEIPLLEMLTGCLPPRVQIEMSSGETMPIENFKNEFEVVRAGDGSAVSVAGLTKGVETKLIEIKDDKKHSLRLSFAHPVILEDGNPLPANKLKPGMKVKTRNGISTLTSVETVAYDGPVYNLTLAEPWEPKTKRLIGNSFYADGFLVGDNTLQAKLAKKQRMDPVAARKRLPKIYQVDFDSYMEDSKR